MEEEEELHKIKMKMMQEIALTAGVETAEIQVHGT